MAQLWGILRRKNRIWRDVVVEAEHFLEPIAFDKFEIEFLRPHGRSTDPRNDFGTNA